MTQTVTNTSEVILFDGVCNLCSSSVQFIINRDRGRYTFSSLQSKFGERTLINLGLNTTEFHSLILLQNNKALQRSDAALEIARHLTGGWPIFYVFKVLPRFIRDPVYNWISRNRYRWFGKKDSCWLPTQELKSRFVDA